MWPSGMPGWQLLAISTLLLLRAAAVESAPPPVSVAGDGHTVRGLDASCTHADVSTCTHAAYQAEGTTTAVPWSFGLNYLSLELGAAQFEPGTSAPVVTVSVGLRGGAAVQADVRDMALEQACATVAAVTGGCAPLPGCNASSFVAMAPHPPTAPMPEAPGTGEEQLLQLWSTCGFNQDRTLCRHANGRHSAASLQLSLSPAEAACLHQGTRLGGNAAAAEGAPHSEAPQAGFAALFSLFSTSVDARGASALALTGALGGVTASLSLTKYSGMLAPGQVAFWYKETAEFNHAPTARKLTPKGDTEQNYLVGDLDIAYTGTGFHRWVEYRLSNVNRKVDGNASVPEFHPQRQPCQVSFLLRLSRNTYVDIDEVDELMRFGGATVANFANYIDVERPASASTQHVVMVTASCASGADPTACTARIPLHLRYQTPACEDPSDEEFSGCMQDAGVQVPSVALSCPEREPSAVDVVSVSVTAEAPMQVPVGKLAHASLVAAVTAAVTLGAAALVVFVAVTKESGGGTAAGVGGKAEGRGKPATAAGSKKKPKKPKTE